MLELGLVLHDKLFSFFFFLQRITQTLSTSESTVHLKMNATSLYEAASFCDPSLTH